MFTIKNISSQDYRNIFHSYINDNISGIYDDMLEEFERIGNFEFSNIDHSEFSRLLLCYYDTDDHKLFNVFGNIIHANSGLNDDFEQIISYNVGLSDWMKLNPGKNKDFYFNEVPYSYLDEVKVYLIRSKGLLCFYYKNSENINYEIRIINDNDINKLISGEIHKIMNEWS